MNEHPVVTVLGFLILTIMAIFLGITCHYMSYQECLRTAWDKPCFEGTVEYDGEGECECNSQYGEIEWNIHQGCDWD